MAYHSKRGSSAPRTHNKSILGVLKATEIIDTKPVLPAEILEAILDHLPVPDQLRFAQTCRRMREMVYEDTRWVARLQSMGCWNEGEARRRFEEAVARRRRDTAAAAAAAAGGGVSAASSRTGGGGGSTMLFDASLEEERRRQQQQREQREQQQREQQLAQMRDGFETLALAPVVSGADGRPGEQNPLQDPEALLGVLQSVRSMRGHARQEYARVYGALAPFYWDLVRARTHADPVVFKVFRDPERQAQMLANLRVFSHSDWSEGWRRRADRLAAMTAVFASAVLREFEQGYEFWDVDGRMHRYAHVLDLLRPGGDSSSSSSHTAMAGAPNAASAAVDLFVQKHPLFSDPDLQACNAMDCLRLAPQALSGGDGGSSAGGAEASSATITLEPSRRFFDMLTRKLNEQSAIIGRIFPRPARVFWALVDKVREDIVMEYITPLLDEAHETSMPAYLTAVSGLFEQSLQLYQTLEPPESAAETELRRKKEAAAAAAAAAASVGGDALKKERKQNRFSLVPAIPSGQVDESGGNNNSNSNSNSNSNNSNDDDDDGWSLPSRQRRAKDMAFRTMEPHLDLYLQEELDYFTKQAEAEVADWDRKRSAQDASVESFYMAHFNRQEVKKDFLTSFKKVVMKPVTALPGLAGLGNSGGSAGGRGSTAKPAEARQSLPSPASSSDRTTPLALGGAALPDKAPDDELAAKAALMASRLAGIKTLFSIEVALSLVHAAKTSLGRAAVFVTLGGQAAGEAREQCEAIFVVLLRVLGNGHVKQGFDRAVAHLSQYNPRKAGQSGQGSDAATSTPPLMTFIELVNVGDLISQMVDVFYEQQLAGPKLADRNDFLDPAGLAKKRFEQMIDESVAAGLNKGIDVLMDEVEYLCATTQKPTDYDPGAAAAAAVVLEGGSGSGGAGPSSAGGAHGSGASATDSPASRAAPDIGPTPTAERVVALVRSHTSMLKGSTEKTMLDVFNGEVGLRLFTAVCKHLKRQRISTDGAVRVIADMTLYFDYVRTLRNADLLTYFRALRELSQLYLIDARHHAKEMAVIIADSDRFGGVFRAEEVYEFAERRADWYQVKRDVERAMYGLECVAM